MADLKLCPFCGEQPTVIEDTTYGDCQVLCSCDAEPCIVFPKGELPEAVAAWNTRTEAPGPEATEDGSILNSEEAAIRATRYFLAGNIAASVRYKRSEAEQKFRAIRERLTQPSEASTADTMPWPKGAYCGKCGLAHGADDCPPTPEAPLLEAGTHAILATELERLKIEAVQRRKALEKIKSELTLIEGLNTPNSPSVHIRSRTIAACERIRTAITAHKREK